MHPRVIRDDIHGDIPLSSLDARGIDDPLFQRLRGVRQSAAAHLVFPTMRVTRFEHSIGVMHLTSLILRGVLVNTSRVRRATWLDAIAELVEALPVFGRQPGWEGTSAAVSLSDLYPTVHDERVTHGLVAAFDVAARTSGASAAHERWAAALAVCEQALRLCALLHDVGHLPFSHDFELAVSATVSEGEVGQLVEQRVGHLGALGTHLHEAVSLGLSSVIRDRLAQGTGADEAAEGQALFDQAAFALARRLLLTKSNQDIADLEKERTEAPDEALSDPGGPIARWLYSLIDGEIDADRTDYILRDSAGYTLGADVFDLSRLLNAIAVVGDPKQGGRPVTVVRPSGVGAAEGYFLARFRLYSNAIYHHRIQNATAGLRYAVSDCIARSQSEELDGFFDVVSLLAEHGSSPQSAEPLGSLQDKAVAAIREAAQAFARYDDARMRRVIDDLVVQANSREFHAWRSFTDRQSGLRTLWKRATDSAVGAVLDPVWTQTVRRDTLSPSLLKQLRSEGVIVGFVDPKFWKVDDSGESRLQIALDDSSSDPRLEPLSKHAPLFAALKGVADLQIDVLAFQFPDVPSVDPASVALRLGEDAGEV